MFDFLNKPYPSVIEDGYKKPNLINLLISMIIVLFLFIFKPSNLFFTIKIDFTFFVCLLFGGIALLVSSIFTNILPLIFKDYFHYKNWTVGKEIFFILSLLITISTFNFFIGWRVFFYNTEIHFYLFLQTLLNTFVIAIFPIFVAISLNLITSQNRASKASKKFNTQLSSVALRKNSEPIKVIIKGNGKYETLRVNSTDILFIESAGNYSDIYYLEAGLEVRKTTFRSTLQQLENQLTNFQYFFRSHRSFIVNINQVVKSSGNAQGYQLTIKRVEDKEVPVSRSKITAFNTMFEQ